MRDEYDFWNAERGRFYRPNAVLAPPVHLDPEVLAFLMARAEARGVTLSELVNTLLRKTIELIEAGRIPERRWRSAACGPAAILREFIEFMTSL